MSNSSPTVDSSVRKAATYTRDAALYSLIKDDESLAERVKERLVTQARRGADFSDRSRWCLIDNDGGGHNPFFQIASTFHKIAYAYGYVRHRFSPTEAQERAEVEAMLHEFAIHQGFLVEEKNKDYLGVEERNEVHDESGDPVYDNGPREPKGARQFNNRILDIAAFTAVVAELVDDDRLRSVTQDFAKGYIYRGLFPEKGLSSDWHRGTKDYDHKGIGYGTACMGHVIELADIQARNGDSTVYDYVAPNGNTLLKGMKIYARYARGDLKHTLGGKPVTHFITNVYPGDAYFAQANLYYRDAYLENTIYRDYPERPASNGPHQVWQGSSGTQSGVLFKYGQLEGVVDPYP